MNFHWDIEQRSEEWFDLRRGRITASVASQIMTPTGKPSTMVKKLLPKLLAEKHIDREAISREAEEMGVRDPYFEFDNYWLARGRKLEPEALAWFRLETALAPATCGFVSVGDRLGVSPDALAAGDGDHWIPVELKCPSPEVHLSYLMEDGVPKEYIPQVHAQMALLEAPRAYFMSYCPGFKPVLVEEPHGHLTDTVRELLFNAADLLAETETKFITEENDDGE